LSPPLCSGKAGWRRSGSETWYDLARTPGRPAAWLATCGRESWVCFCLPLCPVPGKPWSVVYVEKLSAQRLPPCPDRPALPRPAAQVALVGKQRLVLDLSCRKRDGRYYVVTDRWQRFSDLALSEASLAELAGSCDEFLVHGVDVEGMQLGIDDELVELLGRWAPIPVTYAGGARTLVGGLGLGAPALGACLLLTACSACACHACSTGRSIMGLLPAGQGANETTHVCRPSCSWNVRHLSAWYCCRTTWSACARRGRGAWTSPWAARWTSLAASWPTMMWWPGTGSNRQPPQLRRSSSSGHSLHCVRFL
jgi:hypothetical protein